MEYWMIPVWLVLALTATILFRRWIELQLQGIVLLLTNRQRLAVWVFFLLFFPGILVHEVSHWLMAKLLFVPTGRITLWPQVKRDGSVWLGTVEVGKTDPVRSSLVGLAPLLSGSLLVILIARHLQLEAWGAALATLQWSVLAGVVNNSLFTPDFWLWMYFLFSIANRMLPSPSDREHWTPVLVFLGLVAALCVFGGWTVQIPAGVRDLGSIVVAALANAYTVTAVVNLAVTMALVAFVSISGLLLQRRITYRTR